MAIRIGPWTQRDLDRWAARAPAHLTGPAPAPTSPAPVPPAVDPWPTDTDHMDLEPLDFEPLGVGSVDDDTLAFEVLGEDPDPVVNAPITAPLADPGDPVNEVPDPEPLAPTLGGPRPVPPPSAPAWPARGPRDVRKRWPAAVLAVLAVTVAAIALVAAAAINVVLSPPHLLGTSGQRNGSLGLGTRRPAPTGVAAPGAPSAGTGSSGAAVPDRSAAGAPAAPTGPPPPVHAVSAPLGGLVDGELDVVAGVTTVTVRAAAIDDDLYRAVTPATAGYVPRVVQNGGRVQLDLDNINQADHAPAVEVLLSQRVRWQIRMLGGAATATVDLRGAVLSGLDIVGGARRIELSLPRPTGIAVTRISGGAGEVTVHLPQGVPVRVRIGRGASSATIDGVVHSGIAPGTVFTPRGFDRSRDQQDMDVAAGVSSIVVDRY